MYILVLCKKYFSVYFVEDLNVRTILKLILDILSRAIIDEIIRHMRYLFQIKLHVIKIINKNKYLLP